MVPVPAIADFCLLGAGWLEGLGPLLLVVFWVVRQVMTAVQDQKERERAKQEQGQRRGHELDDEPALGDRGHDFDPVQAEAEKPKDLRSEVADFLQRLDKTLEGEADAFDKPDPEPRPARRGPIDPFEEPPRRKPRPTAPTPVELVLEDEELLAPSRPPQSQPQPRRRNELRHLPESQLAENAAHLGEQIGQTDERLEARLHDKFDHRLGNLRARQDDTDSNKDEAPPASGAARIRKLLTTPGGVRDAIILSEILQRPRD